MTYKEYKVYNKRGTQGDKAIILDFTTKNPKQAINYEGQLKKDSEKVSQIMSIKDREERQKAIKENIELFDY